MRIISGRLRGRRFDPPERLGIRPTTDRAREALFNILAHRFEIEGAVVLDAFAGSGAVALEFASRGAERVVALDAQAKVVSYLAELFAHFATPECNALHVRAEVFLANTPDTFDYIFLDPPYALGTKRDLVDVVFARGLLREGGQLVLEHPSVERYDEHPHCIARRDYGTSAFSFFSGGQLEPSDA